MSFRLKEVAKKFGEALPSMFYGDVESTLNEIRRYKKEFGRHNYGRVLYEYGNFDVSDCDLYQRLASLGDKHSSVRAYSKVLESGCTYKHREKLRARYIDVVTKAVEMFDYSDGTMDCSIEGLRRREKELQR